MKKPSSPQAIADEAVGQARERPETGTAKENVSPQEALSRNAPAPGPQAPISEKSAAAVGERSGEAYSDPREFRAPRGADSANRDGGTPFASQPSGGLLDQITGERLAMMAAAFAAGYVAALAFHRRG